MTDIPKNEEIFEKIKTTMVELLELDPETVTLEADLRQDLGLDSVDMFEMLSELEDTYGLVIKHEELINLQVRTIADVIEMVKMLIGRKEQE